MHFASCTVRSYHSTRFRALRPGFSFPRILPRSHDSQSRTEPSGGTFLCFAWTKRSSGCAGRCCAEEMVAGRLLQSLGVGGEGFVLSQLASQIFDSKGVPA